jgi:hypothetical protein
MAGRLLFSAEAVRPMLIVAARAADPSLRYPDYMKARKAAMLEALVRA